MLITILYLLQGRFTFNDAVHITNADIVVENGLLMKIDAVMVPDGISTLPNNCDRVTYGAVMVTTFRGYINPFPPADAF